MNVHIRIHVCMYIYVYIYIYMHIHVQENVYIYIYMHMYVCASVYMRMSMPMPLMSTPNYPLRDPKYHLMDTIRPSIEVHWGVLVMSVLPATCVFPVPARAAGPGPWRPRRQRRPQPGSWARAAAPLERGVSYKPLEPREGEPRLPNKDY